MLRYLCLVAIFAPVFFVELCKKLLYASTLLRENALKKRSNQCKLVQYQYIKSSDETF